MTEEKRSIFENFIDKKYASPFFSDLYESSQVNSIIQVQSVDFTVEQQISEITPAKIISFQLNNLAQIYSCLKLKNTFTQWRQEAKKIKIKINKKPQNMSMIFLRIYYTLNMKIKIKYDFWMRKLKKYSQSQKQKINTIKPQNESKINKFIEIIQHVRTHHKKACQITKAFKILQQILRYYEKLAILIGTICLTVYPSLRFSFGNLKLLHFKNLSQTITQQQIQTKNKKMSLINALIYQQTQKMHFDIYQNKTQEEQQAQIEISGSDFYNYQEEKTPIQRISSTKSLKFQKTHLFPEIITNQQLQDKSLHFKHLDNTNQNKNKTKNTKKKTNGIYETGLYNIPKPEKHKSMHRKSSLATQNKQTSKKSLSKPLFYHFLNTERCIKQQPQALSSKKNIFNKIQKSKTRIHQKTNNDADKIFFCEKNIEIKIPANKIKQIKNLYFIKESPKLSKHKSPPLPPSKKFSSKNIECVQNKQSVKRSFRMIKEQSPKKSMQKPQKRKSNLLITDHLTIKKIKSLEIIH